MQQSLRIRVWYVKRNAIHCIVVQSVKECDSYQEECDSYQEEQPMLELPKRWTHGKHVMCLELRHARSVAKIITRCCTSMCNSKMPEEADNQPVSSNVTHVLPLKDNKASTAYELYSQNHRTKWDYLAG